MNATDRIARERLAVLQLAERLGNASEACRRSGVDRTSFYQWKRRFAREGVAGLGNRPPVHKSHPQATAADVNRKIVGLALANPAHGCDRIARDLARKGVEVSGVTIQKILHKAGLGTYEIRGAALEARYAEGNTLSSRQIEFLENINPCFRERDVKVGRPGEVLCQGVFFIARFDGLGSVYVHAILDAFSSYAFGALATTTRVEPMLTALQTKALPFFSENRLSVGTLLIGKLASVNVEVLRRNLIGVRMEQRADDVHVMHGFVERFRRIAVTEFMRRPFVRRLSRVGLVRLQSEFDDWLTSYNETRRHDGYSNYGAPPLTVVMQARQKSSR